MNGYKRPKMPAHLGDRLTRKRKYAPMLADTFIQKPLSERRVSEKAHKIGGHVGNIGRQLASEQAKIRSVCPVKLHAQVLYRRAVKQCKDVRPSGKEMFFQLILC